MTAESITAAFEDYARSLGPAEERTAADCQGLLGAYELALRLGGEPEALARVVSPMALGARLAEARAEPCPYCRLKSAIMSAPAVCGDCAQKIALPEEHG